MGESTDGRFTVDTSKRYKVESYALGIPNVMFTVDDNGPWSAEELQQLLDEFVQCHPDHSAWGNIPEKATIFWDFDFDVVRQRFIPVPIAKESRPCAYRKDWWAPNAYCNRGIAYADRGDYDNAIREYGEAIRLKPDYAKAYVQRAMAYADKGDCDSAIQDYAAVIGLQPDDALAYFNRGVAHSKKGDYHAAIKDYTEVIRLLPDHADAYVKRGIAYSRIGEDEAARADETRARQLDQQ